MKKDEIVILNNIEIMYQYSFIIIPDDIYTDINELLWRLSTYSSVGVL